MVSILLFRYYSKETIVFFFNGIIICTFFTLQWRAGDEISGEVVKSIVHLRNTNGARGGGGNRFTDFFVTSNKNKKYNFSFNLEHLKKLTET